MTLQIGLLSTRKIKKLKKFGYRLRDLIWPMLEPVGHIITADDSKIEWPDTSPSTIDVLEASYSLLKEELKTEDDRSKITESKLQGILSVTS